jgi:hypothetical protein
MRTFKQLSELEARRIIAEVKRCLHAGRDWMRNRKMNTITVPFDMNDPYYGEAFGIMRALEVLGYGEFKSDNVPNSIYPRWNLKWWFARLGDEVLKEENFDDLSPTGNQCDHCLEAYGKDAVRIRTKRNGVDVIVPIERT